MRPTVLLLFFLFFINFFPKGSDGQDPDKRNEAKDSLRNAIGAELFGRGQVYSISYRRKFGKSLDHWVSFNTSYYGGSEFCLTPSYSFIPWRKGIFRLKTGVAMPHIFVFDLAPEYRPVIGGPTEIFYHWVLMGEIGGNFKLSEKLDIELNALPLIYWNAPYLGSYDRRTEYVKNFWIGIQLNYRF